MNDQWPIERGTRQFCGLIEHLITGLFDGLGRIVDHGTQALGLIAIPVADFVTSAVAASAMITVLGFQPWMAILAGLAMEGVSVLAATVPMRQNLYNQTRDKVNDPKALEGIGWAVLVVQTSVCAVLVALYVVPADAVLFGIPLNMLGIGALGVQSITATAAAAMYGNINRCEAARDARIETERQEAEAERERHAADLAVKRAERAERKVEQGEREAMAIPEHPARTERQAAIIRYAMEHRDASLERIAEAVGTSKTTVHKEVAAVGMKKNGHGWEAA